MLYCEGGGAPAQVAQRICACRLPGSAQGQVGWGFEQLGVVEGVPAHSRGVELGDLGSPFQPKPFHDSMTQIVVLLAKMHSILSL